MAKANAAPESILNRKALRDFHILDRYEAGIELKGSEVKSIRAGKANISDAFARIDKGEAFLHNADIQPYERASHEVPPAKRVRKLLLHRQEIDKLYGETAIAGRTIVLLKLYWKSGRLKAELGVATGKVAHDKRADLKKRATDRETEREVARFNRRHS
jgi:SsrA-binding protein